MSSSDPGHIGGPVVIPNCIQVMFAWTMPNGREAINVLHGSVSGGFTATTAVANAIKAALTTGGTWSALNAFLSTQGSFKQVRLLDLRSPSLATVDSTSAVVPGDAGADVMAPSTAVVVTERTARAGPGFRGRFYVPNWTSDASATGGAVQSTAITNLQAWANTIPAAFTASALTLCLGQPARAAYTGSTGTAHPARAAGTVAVTELIVRNALWDTQRRRGGRT